MTRHVHLQIIVSLLIVCICIFPLTAMPTAAVINNTYQESPESLHGVLQKTNLEPALRDEIRRIRFSADGKYILAQDDNGINVLTRSPFAISFRIEAPNVSRASFTPDSRNVVFYDSAFLVQQWGVAEQKLRSSVGVTVAKYCSQTVLSPDGRTLACLEEGRNVVLIDVATSAQIFRKDDFHTDPFEGMLVLFSAALSRDTSLVDTRVNMEFSPDGRYFAAGVRHLRQKSLIDRSPAVAVASQSPNPKGYGDDPNDIRSGPPIVDVYRPGENEESSRAVAFDMTTRKQVSVGGSLKNLMAGNFTFVGADRIVGIPKKGNSEIVMFPSGQSIAPVSVDNARMETSSRGDYLLVRPTGKYPVGVLDLKSGALLMANKRSAIDLYGNFYVAERGEGELGLYEIGKSEVREKVELPRGALGNLQAVALSPDFRWLAASGGARGAVWDLSKGERIFYLRSFEGAYYSDDGAFYVDFPKHESVERTVGILKTQQREVLQGPPLETSEAARSEQYGQFFAINRRADSKGTANKNASLEVRDVRTMKQLWVKTFAKQRPTLWVDAPNETMALGWNVTEDTAKAEIKNDSRLSKQLSAIKERDSSRFFQILNANTGDQRGSILFDTMAGSLYVAYVIATNDSVVVVTSPNRILVHSLASGDVRTQLSGGYATVNKDANLLCVVNKNTQMTIYDLVTLKARDQFTFSSPVTLARFSNDGKRLFVLTQSQTTYVLDVSRSASP